MTTRLNTTPEGRAAQLRDSLDANILSKAYDGGSNLTRYLEKLDPSSDHQGADGQMDAFNRVLRSAGIRTRSIPELGIQASTLEEIVENERYPNIKFLATEIFARAYRKVVFAKNRTPILSNMTIPGSMPNQYVFSGPRDLLLEPAIPLSELVGITTGINNTYYKPFYMEDVTNANSRVAESSEIPAVKIATSEKTINLVKYGRRLDTSYEAMRRIPIDLISFYVQRIAIAVESEKVDTVLDVLVNGDGNAGTAATNYNLDDLNGAAAAGTFNLQAWLSFKMKWTNPLMMTTVLAQDSEIIKLLLLDTGSANIPLANYPNFAGATQMTAINQSLRDGIRYGWTADAPANKLVAFDRRMAIERVFEIGSSIQETATDVKSQLNSLVLSEVEGYAIIDPDATKTLAMNA